MRIVHIALIQFQINHEFAKKKKNMNFTRNQANRKGPKMFIQLTENYFKSSFCVFEHPLFSIDGKTTALIYMLNVI